MEEKLSNLETSEISTKKEEYSKRGKRNRAAGARFELKVREELEKEGWIIDKWTNNVDLIEKKLIKAKRKYNPFLRALSIGTGFPDFIAFRKSNEGNYDIIGVEVKKNGCLDREEKEKCAFLLSKEIFSKILIAKQKKDKRNISVEYVDFKEKYLKE